MEINDYRWNEEAIYCDSKFGHCFGRGDLMIEDNANIKTSKSFLGRT